MAVKVSIQSWAVALVSLGVIWAVGVRAVEAFQSLWTDKTGFLAFPLTVMIPALAFFYLATRRGLTSQEGVLMQLGTMIQLFLIIALPGVALYLVLGFPVVFLVVEIFETRFPEGLRTWVKARVVT